MRMSQVLKEKPQGREGALDWVEKVCVYDSVRVPNTIVYPV